MSKVKIPLKWYSDLISIPGTENEYLLIEWFEEEDCKNKTLWCLGEYLKVTQYHIIGQNLEKISNYDLTRRLLNNELNSIKLGEYVQENIMYFPPVYLIAKREKWFEED